MNLDKKWVKVLGLTLSLPSTIFMGAILARELSNSELISKPVAFIIFFLVTGNLFFLIIWYAVKSKD